MFLNFLWLWVQACFTVPSRLLIALPAEGFTAFFKRLLLFPLLGCCFLLLNFLHLLGFILDEVFFPRYRKTTIKSPLFILGIPRSGTTHLQRVLACDGQFTTLRTWEVLFAPSITERHVYRFFGHLLSPLGFIAAKTRKLFFGAMDEVHLFGLLEAEEDFFLLLWIDHCFLMAFLCPQSAHYWSLGKFRTSLSTSQQQSVMNYYSQCLQKHLYFHGESLTILSKNPSFTSLLPALKKQFLDARFVFCIRSPEKIIASQLSSLKPAMKLIGQGKLNSDTQEKLLDVLLGYYGDLPDTDDGTTVMLPMQTLMNNLPDVIATLYRKFGLTLSADFSFRLKNLHQQSRKYKTGHQYTLDDFGMNEETLLKRFSAVWPPDSPLELVTDEGSSVP